jgi:hypothetical protein
MPKSKKLKRGELGGDELRALSESLGVGAQTTERAVQMRLKPPEENAGTATANERKGRPPRPLVAS